MESKLAIFPVSITNIFMLLQGHVLPIHMVMAQVRRGREWAHKKLVGGPAVTCLFFNCL